MSLTLVCMSLLLPLAHAGVVKPAGVTASTSLTGDEGVSYDVKNVVDGKQSTVWVEGVDGSGLGSWVQIDLGGSKEVKGLRIWNGNWYTHDFWQRHNRAKEIEVELSDGNKHSFTLTDQMQPEMVTFSSPVNTASVKVRIKGIYRGNTFNDTCLAEIQVLDTSPVRHVPVQRYEASTIYPADGDGSYDPMNLSDTLLDSMWCEGNTDGDGTGEWIMFDFGQSRRVSKLKMRNGNAYSFSFNMKGNRAKAATLEFSDGSREQISLKPSMIEQTVLFPPHDTTSVRITFTSVAKGSKFNDLCISEAVFVE